MRPGQRFLDSCKASKVYQSVRYVVSIALFTAKLINALIKARFTNAAINILTDFAIIILPMPVIRSLNLARRQKQALIGIFAIGGL